MLMRLLARDAFLRSGGGAIGVTLACATRHARRRARAAAETNMPAGELGDDEAVEPRAPPNVSLTAGLRSAAFVAPSSSSIDAVRQEIEAMHLKAKREEFERQVRLEAARAAAAQPASSSSSAANVAGPGEQADSSGVSPQLKPSFDPLQPKVVESVRCRDNLVRAQLMQDVKEVFRKRREGDILRLLQHAMPEFANELYPPRKGHESSRQSASRSEAPQALSDVTREALYKLTGLVRDACVADSELDDAGAIAVACDQMTDRELSVLMRAGIIDPLSLSTSRQPSETEVATAGTSPPPASESVDDAPDGALDDLVDSPQRMTELFQTLENSEQLISVLAGDMRGQPTEDLAPVLVKAKRGIYGQVSESELQLLEEHEKVGRDTITDATVSPNAFLRAVGKFDTKVQASLDVLDRARRSAVLDANFQNALNYVNRRAEEKFNSLSNLKVKMRPKAAEIPFFFANARSKPPPAADMNLPEPTKTPEERRAARSAFRKSRRKSFFRR